MLRPTDAGCEPQYLPRATEEHCGAHPFEKHEALRDWRPSRHRHSPVRAGSRGGPSETVHRFRGPARPWGALRFPQGLLFWVICSSGPVRLVAASPLRALARLAIAYSRVDTGRTPSAVLSSSNFPASHFGSEHGLIARSYQAISSPPLGRPAVVRR